MSPSDRSLLESWQSRRDAEAFQELVQRYAAMVYRTSLRILRNVHDAEEVAQDCFLSLANAPARAGGYVGPWLHRVATTRSLDRRKSEQRRSARELQASIPDRVNPQVPVDDLFAFVDEAIASLSESESVVVVAHFLEGQTQEAIAERLGISQQAVSHRIRKGVEHIRAALGRRGIAVTVGAISAAFASGADASVPASLQLALGKYALLGIQPAGAQSAGGAAAAVMGGLLVKKSIAGAAAVVIVAGILYVGKSRLAEDTPADAPTPAQEQATLPVEASPPNPGAGSVLTRPAQLDPARLAAVAAPELEPGEIADPALFATVSGSVTDLDGAPVAGVPISIFTPGVNLSRPEYQNNETLSRILGNGRHGFHGKSDADGRFTITGIRFEGQAIVAANPEGYWVENREVGFLELEPGATIEHVDFRVAPGKTIYGVVLSPTDVPVSGASVFCKDSGASFFTKSDGTFHLSLPSEHRRLTFYVSHEVHGRTTFGDIEFAEGQLIELELAGMATLIGRVTLAAGAPAVGYLVKLDDALTEDGPSQNEILPYFATVDKDGAYRIDGIEIGTYVAQVLAADKTPASAPEAIGELQNGRTRTWDSSIDEAMRVRGVVRSESRRQPMSGKHVVWAVDGQIVGTTQTNARGEYELALYAGGGRHMVAALPTALPHDDALPEIGRAYGTDVTVSPGGELTLDLELPDTYSAAAYFVDETGEPVVSGIRVLASMADITTGSGGSERLQADASGRYQWDKFQIGLHCGIVAYPEDGSDYIYARTPTFDGPAESGQLEFVVQLYRGARMAGRALDIEGRPLSGTEIWCNLELENGEVYGPLTTTTSGNGGFTFEAIDGRVPSAVPAAAFRVTAYYSDATRTAHEWKSELIETQVGQTLDLGTIQFEVREEG